MPVRTAEARWKGDLRSGKGRVKLGSRADEGAYSFATRFGDVPGIDAVTFQKAAEDAKKGCPVSKALAAVPQITLTAKLL